MAETRMIRRSIIDSDRFNSLSWVEQAFYTRLLLVADDYGLFDARPTILLAGLFPTRLDTMSVRDIQGFFRRCEEFGLIKGYSVKGKEYGMICGYGQICKSLPKLPIPSGYKVVERSQTSAKSKTYTLVYIEPNRTESGRIEPNRTDSIVVVEDEDYKDLSLSREALPECVERSLSPENAPEPCKVVSRVKALPLSADEVGSYLQSQVSTRIQGDELKACAVRFFDECEGSGWLDPKHRPINNWQAAARVYASRWANNASNINNNQSNRKKINDDNFDV